ncbi:hypothetical protein FHU36_005082 [Nonomuraea muscovyensis]|uniref:Uncharacterized protein n=1 Tax=Nonomuraea muscovyensis TaxID=1124761 RepID=A0A7X0C4T8_9ACTN|nr:hypothetical protein [Nonomuraea muscovyensis]MBB6348537.1 hypothetical protein [Nonomuraea muscovyensis]
MLGDRQRVQLVWRDTKAAGPRVEAVQAAGLRMPRVKAVPSHRLRAGQVVAPAELPGLAVALFARP